MDRDRRGRSLLVQRLRWARQDWFAWVASGCAVLAFAASSLSGGSNGGEGTEVRGTVITRGSTATADRPASRPDAPGLAGADGSSTTITTTIDGSTTTTALGATTSTTDAPTPTSRPTGSTPVPTPTSTPPSSPTTPPPATTTTAAPTTTTAAPTTTTTTEPPPPPPTTEPG